MVVENNLIFLSLLLRSNRDLQENNLLQQVSAAGLSSQWWVFQNSCINMFTNLSLFLGNCRWKSLECCQWFTSFHSKGSVSYALQLTFSFCLDEQGQEFFIKKGHIQSTVDKCQRVQITILWPIFHGITRSWCMETTCHQALCQN